MTTPTTPGGATRPGNRVLVGLTGALAAALIAAHLLGPGGAPGTATINPCGRGALLVMRAADTAQAAIVGDTVFVVPGDSVTSAPRLASDSAQAFTFRVDSGATMQLVAVCALVSPSYRLKLVPALPSAAPAPVSVALAIAIPATAPP